MDGVITFAGQNLIIFSIVGTIFLILKLPGKKRQQLITLLLVSAVFSLALAKLGHHVYENPRPFITDHTPAIYTSSIDNGFPSDHTLLAALLGFVALAFSRKIGIGLLIVALLVAWGRVAGHVHHFTDVFASFAIAGAVTWALAEALKRYDGGAVKRRSKEPPK